MSCPRAIALLMLTSLLLPACLAVGSMSTPDPAIVGTWAHEATPGTWYTWTAGDNGTCLYLDSPCTFATEGQHLAIFGDDCADVGSYLYLLGDRDLALWREDDCDGRDLAGTWEFVR